MTQLLPYQRAALSDYQTRHLALASGLGAGKTHTGPFWLHDRVTKNPKSDFWYVAQEYQIHEETIIPRIIEIYRTNFGLFEGYHYRFKRSSITKELFLEYLHPKITSKVRFKSARNWKKFVGNEIAGAIFEEPAWTSIEAYRHMNNRVRCKNANTPLQVLYLGTPDIVPACDNWFYDIFAGDMGRGMEETIRAIHAPSAANPYRDPNYLKTLTDNYGHNKALFECYALGLFRLVSEGVAMDKYTRANVVQVAPDRDNQTMQMTWDFNVGLTYWCTLQEKKGVDFVVDEVREPAAGTHDACEMFEKQYPLYDKFGGRMFKDHRIQINGDSSGYQGGTKALNPYDGDYDIIEEKLKNAGYNVEVVAPRSNPSIRTRIETTNNRFFRKLLMVSDKCTILDNGLVRTTRDDLLKKKSTTTDTWTHPVDALGYDQTDRHPIIAYGTEAMFRKN